MLSEEQSHASTNLLDVPKEILETIFRSCNLQSLGTFSCTSKYARWCVKQQEVWREHCLKRWPQGSISWYNGDWMSMYGSRSKLPGDVVWRTDAAYRLFTELQAGSVRSANQTFQLFLDHVRYIANTTRGMKSFSTSVELTYLRTAIAYWLEQHPQVVLSRLQACHEDLVDYGERYVEVVSQTRQAIGHMLEGHLAFGGHASVKERIRRAMHQLDRDSAKICVAMMPHLEAPSGSSTQPNHHALPRSSTASSHALQPTSTTPLGQDRIVYTTKCSLAVRVAKPGEVGLHGQLVECTGGPGGSGYRGQHSSTSAW